MKNFARLMSLLLGLVAASTLWAHAFLEHAQPAVGSTVHAAPTRVELRFSEQLEPAFSTLRVVDRDGKAVDRHDKSVPDGDRTRMAISLTPLRPGKYRVIWRAVSLDTHVTEGDFVFELAP